MALTEGQHTGEFIESESNGYRSRETVTILSGQTVKAGHVLGKVTKGAATGAAVAGNTGNGTITASPTVGTGAKAGVYMLTCIEPATNLGKFTVEDPDGITIGVATVGTQFTTHLTFTIADGSTDFVSGDSFTITVAAGSGKYKEYNPANTDGSEKAVAIAYDNVDASGGDKKGVIIARDATVTAAELIWFSGADANQKAAGLAQLATPTVGIIGR